MGLTALLLVAVALAMDAFAVCVAAGASGRSRGPRAAFRLSFHFGLFQALMPALGWIGGQTLAAWLHGWHRWIAAALLAGIGLRMIVAAAQDGAGAGAADHDAADGRVGAARREGRGDHDGQEGRVAGERIGAPAALVADVDRVASPRSEEEDPAGRIDHRGPGDPSRGWSLVGLSVGTSIDALAVGVSLSMLEASILRAAVTIGLVAAGFSLAGLRLGQFLGARLGSRAEMLGGVILLAVAVKVALG